MSRFFDLGFAIDETAPRPDEEMVILIDVRLTLLPGDKMLLRVPKAAADPDHAAKIAALRATIGSHPVVYGRGLPLDAPTADVRRLVKDILRHLRADMEYWLAEAREQPERLTSNGVTREQEYSIRANEMGNTIGFIRLRYLKHRRFLAAWRQEKRGSE